MKVLLASLAIEPATRSDNFRNAAYPIGLAYLHAVLQRAGHTARLLFYNNFDYSYSDENFFRELDEMRPEVVGFQIFSMNRISTFAAIEKLRALNPDVRIVVGGVHASIMAAQIVERFPYVVAVIGEGEETLLELLESFQGGRQLREVKGICYSDGRGPVITGERELITDLDSLPFPSHEVFFESEPARDIAHMVASRGCPFDCSFCCLKAVSRRRYRARSVEKVVQEIKELKARYPQLKEIQFHDDTLLLDNQRIIKMCKQLAEADLGVDFVCSARVKPISEEMFLWMRKAGFTKIMFGLETGSPKLLDAIHKKITRQDVLDLFNALRPFDFDITTFLMCGFPGETLETIDETIALVRETQRIHYNWIAGVGKLFVYPGTEVYSVMKAAGKIDDSFWLTDKPVPYFTVEHDLQGLIRLEERLMVNLSFLRIFTFKGFINHFLSMPGVITRVLLMPKNRKILLSIFAGQLQRSFPGFYSRLYGGYQRFLRRRSLARA